MMEVLSPEVNVEEDIFACKSPLKALTLGRVHVHGSVNLQEEAGPTKML